MKPLAAVLLIAGVLSACGASGTANSAARKTAPQPTPAPTASQTPGRYVGEPSSTVHGLFHARLNMSEPVDQEISCGDYNAAGPPTVAENVQSLKPDSQTDRAAVVATVVRIGTAVWNTPDGHRWTQAEINAGTVVDPSVYTPFVLQVQRLLGNTIGVTTGETITGYLQGGQTADGDYISTCDGPVVTPQPGWSVVAFFGSEVDTPTLSPTLHRPIVEELDVIKDGAVQTHQGPQPIP